MFVCPKNGCIGRVLLVKLLMKTCFSKDLVGLKSIVLSRNKSRWRKKLQIIEWGIWFLALAFGLWILTVFIIELFYIKTLPLVPFEPQDFLSPILRKIITGLYATVMAVAIGLTGFGYVSKWHLLWFIPLYHFLSGEVVYLIIIRFCCGAVNKPISIKQDFLNLISRITQKRRLILSPKKTSGPDSRLKDYPLLYLYFDNFNEITKAWNSGYFEAARHESDIRSCRFSIDQIMNDENLFLALYEKGLLRLKLHDGTRIVKQDEDFYWDQVKNPGKGLFFPSNDQMPGLAERQAEYRKDLAILERVVEAIKLRYGLMNSDET